MKRLGLNSHGTGRDWAGAFVAYVTSILLAIVAAVLGIFLIGFGLRGIRKKGDQ